MMGKTHRIWGAHQGAVAGAAVGSLWSPQTGFAASVMWSGLGYALATLPDRMERPLGLRHRGPTHWPEPPLILALVALAVAASPLNYWVLLGGLAVAGACNSIFSHWTGDFAFGKAHVSKDEHGNVNGVIRPRGVPYFFGTRYTGLGFKVDGKGEKYFRRFLLFTFPVTFFGSLFIVLGG